MKIVRSILSLMRSIITLCSEEHMKLLKITMILMVAAVMAFGSACSEDDKFPIFQNNNGSTAPGGADYDPFGFLPNNPGTIPSESPLSTLLDAFDPTGGLTALMLLDPTAYEQFVDRLALIIDEADANNKRDEVYWALHLVDTLANDLPYAEMGHGAYGLMESLKNIMSYVIGQDALDEAPYGGTGASYIDDLYVFMDKIRDSDLDLKYDIFELLFKVLDYTDDTYVQTALIQQIMTDLRAFLSDTTDPNLTWLVYNLQEALGKIMMRANSNIYFDDPLNWDQAGTTAIDIKLGNAVSGMDYLLQAITDMISPNNTTDGADVRGDIYGILEQVGKLVSALQGSPADIYYPFSDLKCLLMNIEDYFTVGGAVYGSSTDYNDPVGGTPSSYVNAELRNGVKELWPGLVKLFIRERAGGASDPDYSIVYSANHQRSPVEWLTRAMYQLKKSGIDYSDEANYAIEPSLKQAVQYNAYGQVRSGSVLNMSMLDHMMLTITGGYTFGYKTRPISGLSTGTSGNYEPYPNAPCSGNGGTSSYLHGLPTGGILTINDTMYSVTNSGLNTVASALGSVDVLDVWSDSYNLGLANRTTQGSYNWRSSDPFDYDDDKTNYRFYIGYDYPALCLLPASAAGDVGIPQGGRTAIVPTTDTTGTDATNNDYRTYFPEVADGVGDLNTGTWIFSWIARACWDGAGPYYGTDGALTGVTNATLQDAGNCPTCPDWPGKGTAPFDVVFKPNGEAYAYIDRSGDPWLYYYPVSGNDVVDPDAAANSQRYNRYRDVCRSDYYMVQNGHNHGSSDIVGLGALGLVSSANATAYCVPPMNPDGDAFVEGTTGGDKYKLQPGNHDAQYFQIYETVVEWSNDDSPNPDDPSYPYRGNTKRQCATQEEAMYRNYQWLMLEKKFMFVIPLNLYARWGVMLGYSYLDSAAFIIIESNGVVGSTNAARGTANGRWLQLGDEGVGADNNSPADHRNYPDYGNSLRPGDARIMAFAYEYIAKEHMSGAMESSTTISNGTVDPNVVFGLLGNGHVMPDIVGSNIVPVARLGFVTPSTIPSSRFSIGSADWTNRNKLLPIFAALAGVMKDGTRYVAGSGNNYNYAGHHKYPLRELMENVLVPLSKPHMRVFNGDTTYGIRWVPRMIDETINNYNNSAYPSGTNPNFAYFMPNIYSGDQDPDYRPRASLRSLMSFLADSRTTTYADGLIPALADNNNRLVTRLLSLLQRLGNNETGSVYRDVAGGGLGILENFSRGLEQIFTSIQLSEGDLAANGYGYLNDSRYHWMYKSNGDRTTGALTPISIDLDVALNQLIGNNTDDENYGGISTFVDRHGPQGAGGPVPTGDWANYDRLLNALVALIGEPGTGAYDIMGSTDASTPGSVIRVMDKLLGSVAADENDVKALRHTLGVLMARYQGGNWEPSTAAESELYVMLNQLLPETLGAFDTHYGDFVVAFKSLLDYNLDSSMDPEALEYLIDLLVPGDSAEEIVNNMYNLLNRDAMFDPAYWTAGGYMDHATLIELAEICQDIIAINNLTP
ncbi:MAG: hypothetical protein JW807_04685 [Spirochaetes bacterium]|nr:hypothetical protein [Spirochaetota bacterium]